MKKLSLVVALTALLLAGCAPTANETAPAATTPPALKVVNGRTDANPALWVVKDADTTIYLFGTVHVLRDNIDWFDGAVKRAYDASGDLVLEVVAPTDAAAAQKTVMAIAVDPDGPPLSQKLDTSLRSRYTAAMTKAGLPAPQMETLEPWFVASLLGTAPLEKLGYTPADGAETVLSAAATRTGKPIAGLETFSEQLGFLDGLPEPVQIRFLASTIDEMENAEKIFGELVDSWARGDADRLATLMNEGMREIPEIGRVLLTDRNVRWAQWVDDRLDRPGTSFVAVGAGHLAGADSVQAVLTKRGFKVTRVQ